MICEQNENIKKRDYKKEPKVLELRNTITELK